MKSPLGKALGSISEKTSKVVKGASVYRVNHKMKIGDTKLKPGDQYYLDKNHDGDHVEVFNRRNKAKGVLNLNGSTNFKKTQQAINQGREI